MFFKVAFLTSILNVVSTQMSISCYSRVGAGGAKDCAQFITNFCNVVSDETIMPTESSGHCYNLGNGKRCDFMAFNSRGENGSPAVANCQEILGNVTSQCGLGGYGHPSVTGYTFTVDLNSGHCGEVTWGEGQIEE